MTCQGIKIKLPIHWKLKETVRKVVDVNTWKGQGLVFCFIYSDLNCRLDLSSVCVCVYLHFCHTICFNEAAPVYDVSAP